MEDKITILKDELMYLLEMTYGYIDDELGGMESKNEHSNKLREILNKYGIALKI